MTRWRGWLLAATLIVSLGGSLAHAGELRAVVRDHQDQPVADAVVLAVPESGATPPRPGRDVVDQINSEFMPYVKPVTVGSAVSFPNRDNIRHHVYSFSPAKLFELPLYVGTPARPVVFDRPGVVTLGCNIHDWMIGHIYVAETPYLGKTNAKGTVALENLPPGRYAVRVWHPTIEETEASTIRRLDIGSAASEVAWKVTLKREIRARRAPVPGQRGYR